jgi:NAD(P)-dependent dehydrogenase (short-subunit alcohol dehydrogenase family)
MELGLKGKTVIITGGGSNIGRAIVLAFAKEGSNIAIAEIDENQGKKVADEANAIGGKTIVIKTDVTSYEQVEAMVKKTIEQFGAVDVLVNNVGWDQLQLFIDTTPDFWDKIIDINYKGMLNCTKAVLGHMIERKSGNIVSIASDAGRMGEFREAVYGGCKGAQIALSKAVARETGRHGIRLNIVCPGMTIPTSEEEVGDESMWKLGFKFFTDEMKEKAIKNYPLRRLGTAEDIAHAVVFLASDAANFITGQTLSVSGGYTMM